jgi:hypothetical protein
MSGDGISDGLPDFPDLFAYVGEDELGSGVIGLKAAMAPAGFVPLVAIESHREKLTRDSVVAQLQAQADKYRKPIRFVRYIAVQEVATITPCDGSQTTSKQITS